MKTLWTLLTILALAQGARYDSKLKGGRKSAPGIEIRLLKEALDYIHEVGTFVLNEAIPRMRIPTITQPIDNGKVKIYDSVINGYKAPQNNQFRLISPNKFRFIIEDTATVVDGRFDAQVNALVPIDAKGKYKLLIHDMDVHADLAFSKARGGQPKIQQNSVTCWKSAEPGKGSILSGREYRYDVSWNCMGMCMAVGANSYFRLPRTFPEYPFLACASDGDLEAAVDIWDWGENDIPPHPRKVPDFAGLVSKSRSVILIEMVQRTEVAGNVYGRDHHLVAFCLGEWCNNMTSKGAVGRVALGRPEYEGPAFHWLKVDSMAVGADLTTGTRCAWVDSDVPPVWADKAVSRSRYCPGIKCCGLVVEDGRVLSRFCPSSCPKPGEWTCTQKYRMRTLTCGNPSALTGDAPPCDADVPDSVVCDRIEVYERRSYELSNPYCRARADVEVQLYDTGAFLDLILRGIRGIINNQVRTGLQTKLCEVIKKTIEEDANRLLEDFPLSTNVDEKLGKIGNLFGLSKGANMTLGSVEILRYGLVRDPKMSPAYDHATIGLDGEISKVYIHVSDHLINSFLYSLTHEKLLKLIVSPTTFPDFATKLRTSCFSVNALDLCIGDLLSDLEEYEDHDVAMSYTPSVAPTLFFEDGKAVITAVGESRLMVRPEGSEYAHQRWKTVYKSDIKFTGHANIWMTSDKISGNFTIGELATKLKWKDPKFTSTMEDAQDELEEMTNIAKEFMSTSSSGLLGGDGFPLPAIDGMRWLDPRMSTERGFIRIKSWFELNRRMISDLVNKAISKANFG